MARSDISRWLIHFTKGTSIEGAFLRLRKIISESTLLASGNLIRGGYPCICFSEAPLPSLVQGLVNPAHYSKYSPFGVMVSKQWLFERGGRPVIYQPDDEYAALPESHKWRHVRYEPPTIDFSWEREWRIHCESLSFDCHVAAIVVQDDCWAKRLIEEHEWEQQLFIEQYRLVLDEDTARLYYEPFQWRVLPLR
jgi:hypothetical protein